MDGFTTTLALLIFAIILENVALSFLLLKGRKDRSHAKFKINQSIQFIHKTIKIQYHHDT